MYTVLICFDIIVAMKLKSATEHFATCNYHAVEA